MCVASVYKFYTLISTEKGTGRGGYFALRLLIAASLRKRCSGSAVSLRPTLRICQALNDHNSRIYQDVSESAYGVSSCDGKFVHQ